MFKGKYFYQIPMKLKEPKGLSLGSYSKSHASSKFSRFSYIYIHITKTSRRNPKNSVFYCSSGSI